MNIKRKTYYVMIIYSVILLLGIVIAFQGSNYKFMTGPDVAIIQGDDFFEPMNRRVMKYGEPEFQTFKTQISQSDLPELSNGGYNLVIFRMASNGYEVYFNDRYLGGYGDYDTGDSNLWNGIKRYQIPMDIIKESNELRIENHSKYMTGLTTHPVFVTSTEKAIRMVTRAQFFNHNVVMMNLGIGLLTIIVILVLYLSNFNHNPLYINLGLAMAFLSIYSIDYATTETVFINYMFYKKCIMISFWACSFFVSLGMKQLFDSVYPIVISAAGLLGIIVIAIFSTDLMMFKQLYGIWYITQLISLFSWVLLISRRIRTSIEARVFFTGFVVLLIYSVLNAAFDYSGVFFSMNSPVLYMTTFSIIPMMLLHFDFVRNREKLHAETLLKEAAYQKAITDALTGVYNKHHLFSVMDQFDVNYSVAMFDIDNFMEINDTYGHQGGDVVLMEIVEILGGLLSVNDKIFRYGGDEFIILMEEPLHLANEKMETFRKRIEMSTIDYGMYEIEVTLSIGLFYVDSKLSHHEIIDSVDTALYMSKGDGKNTIRIYQ